MTTTSLPLTDIADLASWQALQARIVAATGLRFGLWDDDPAKVLPEPPLPAACHYVQADKSRRERCEQFHRSVRAEVRRTRKPACHTCPFGMQYMGVPIEGGGLMPGHWEGGFVAVPGTIGHPDPTLNFMTWQAALAHTPMKSFEEIEAALELMQLLHQPAVAALAQRERRRAQVVQLVGAELSRMLTELPSLDEIFNRFTYMVAQTIGVPIALLMLKERATGDMVVRAAHGLSPEATAKTRAPLGEGVAGRVMATGKSLNVGDLQADPDFNIHHAPFDKLNSLLGVPIRLHREVVGVLDVGSFAPQAFNADDVELLEELGALLAGILEQDVLFRLPTRDLDTIAVSLKAASASMRDKLAGGSLLEPVMDMAMRLLEASSGTLMLVEPAKRELVVRVARGIPPEQLIERVPFGEGVAGWVAQSGEPLYVPQVATDSRFANVREDLRSELAVPLVADGQVVGVIDVGSIHHQYFTDEAIQMLTILAALAALAVRAEQLGQVRR